jgi:hypothetical protein
MEAREVPLPQYPTVSLVANLSLCFQKLTEMQSLQREQILTANPNWLRKQEKVFYPSIVTRRTTSIPVEKKVPIALSFTRIISPTPQSSSTTS